MLLHVFVGVGKKTQGTKCTQGTSESTMWRIKLNHFFPSYSTKMESEKKSCGGVGEIYEEGQKIHSFSYKINKS